MRAPLISTQSVPQAQVVAAAARSCLTTTGDALKAPAELQGSLSAAAYGPAPLSRLLRLGASVANFYSTMNPGLPVRSSRRAEAGVCGLP
jgi:hypothetical protein